MGSRRNDVGVVRAACSGFILLLVFASTPVASTEKGAKLSSTPNRFGAIAYHRATQSWGAGYDFARARDANVAALKQCGQKQCEVVHKFRNGCAALAREAKKHVVQKGATRQEAEAKALRRCSAQCEIAAWTCTR